MLESQLLLFSSLPTLRAARPPSLSAILRATLARFILVNRVMIMVVMIAGVIADRRDHDAADLGRRRTRLYGQDIELRAGTRHYWLLYHLKLNAQFVALHCKIHQSSCELTA